MTAATIDAPALRRGDSRPRRTVRGTRPSRGSARTVRPTARSLTGVAAPQVQPRTLRTATARSCDVVAPERRLTATAAVAGWRLTNRGIAVIMVAGAVLAAAALTVIAATALTVTSEDYQPTSSAVAHR